jgi:tRNA pseudouridine55 synthase
MATGVLIVGVGKGTKALSQFLECTKSYETSVLFGASTDTYDVSGRILARAEYKHVTKEKVESALEKFRGEIAQKPPLYSALRVQGKRLYEYAREGKELPVEIQERPVRVDEMRLVQWLEPGEHEVRWPVGEAEAEEKVVAKELLGVDEKKGDQSPPLKRKREAGDEDGEPASPSQKAAKLEDETILLNGMVASESREENTQTFDDEGSPSEKPKEKPQHKNASSSFDRKRSQHVHDQLPPETSPRADAPVAKVFMTVSSGFYVRSLCHDLGKAVGSLGLMAKLVRTRQGQFELGKNVLEYDDISKGEDVWGPKVDTLLDDWNRERTHEP